LKDASFGSSEEIASLLLDKATMGKIKKVKGYLRSIRKKRGAAREVEATD
jgi:DNA-binding CsgD family transcriptional regulator